MAGFDTAQILGLLVGTVLPLLVGLVTKESTDAGVKAVLLAALAAVSGFLSSWLDAVNAFNPFDWKEALLVGVGAFLTGTGVHFGFWKPTGVARAAQRTWVKDRVDLAA